MIGAIARKTRIVDVADPRDIRFGDIVAAGEPVIFKRLIANWPLVEAGQRGERAAMDYLLRFWGGKPVVGYVGGPDINGRYFYDDSATAMNFAAERMPLDQALARIEGNFDRADADSLYIGSTDLDTYLPGFRRENDLAAATEQFAKTQPTVSIWLGSRTTASAHYDMSNNVACCAVGRRRFTLFPPDQITSLYPGPLDPTPGGQVVSMVDFDAPDFDRYPGFEQALGAAQVADLEPGDVLVYPALWWHQVEALDRFNAMVNYWWNDTPAYIDTPWNTVLHGMLSLRDRPEHEKAAWRAVFDHYVFGPANRASSHLPDAARGPLAPLDAPAARRLRAMLLQRFNR